MGLLTGRICPRSSPFQLMKPAMGVCSVVLPKLPSRDSSRTLEALRSPPALDTWMTG